MLTFGSLFAGIGGMDLGLERAGMKCVWQVEIDSYAQKVLAKHWPHVRRHDDVRTFPPEPAADWRCDGIAGGFPCQPVSLAGKQLAQQDERWLWPEFCRVLRVLRPGFALLENVPGLLVRGMGDILGDLAALGFDAEWQVLPAAAFGAPQLRERVFILAYANVQHGGERRQGRPAGAFSRVRISEAASQYQRPEEANRLAPDSDGERRKEQHIPALAARAGQHHRTSFDIDRDAPGRVAGTGEEAEGRWMPHLGERFSGTRGPWRVEPDVVRVVHGVSSRVDRIRGLGNAVVPQVAEFIGYRLLASFGD